VLLESTTPADCAKMSSSAVPVRTWAARSAAFVIDDLRPPLTHFQPLPSTHSGTKANTIVKTAVSGVSQPYAFKQRSHGFGGANR
jgi:hypothetical protein